MSENVLTSTVANTIPTPWFFQSFLEDDARAEQPGKQSRYGFPENIFTPFFRLEESSDNSSFDCLPLTGFPMASSSPRMTNAATTMKSELERLELAFTQKELEKILFSLFENEPIEDGYSHPAEQIVEEVCKKYKAMAGALLQGIYLKNVKRTAFIASLLRCIGRQRSEKVAPWGGVMAIAGLSHSEVEVRDAAIRALESWGGHESLWVLKVYAEIETVSWLKEYIEQVVRDLSD